MATAFDIITSALKLVGVLADGETPSDDTANQGLSVFNDMLDGWNAERQAIFTTRIDDFPLTLAKQVYTLGAGGDFNIPRPARIDAMSAILLQNPDNPIEEPITLWTIQDWQNIPVKNVPGSFPLGCYDDGGFPLRSLSMWPIPQDQPVSARIYSWQALGQPADPTSTVIFPPGYAMAFRYNLAVLMAAEFGVTPDKYDSQTVKTTAITSLARVKSINAPQVQMESDLVPNTGEYNYKADLFGIPY